MAVRFTQRFVGILVLSLTISSVLAENSEQQVQQCEHQAMKVMYQICNECFDVDSAQSWGTVFTTS